MNLWLSSHFLAAGLFLSSWALTPEECRPLVTPLSLDDPSTMHGKFNFIVGYSDNEITNAMFKLTQSSWLNFTASPSSPNEVRMTHGNKLNGTCAVASVIVTIDNNTASTSLANISSVFHLLPTCDGCLLMSVNGTFRNFDKVLRMMNINTIVTGDEMHIRALYLMAKDSTLMDSDMEHFKQQASCLGFSREPDFLYDPKNGFCAEGESIKMTF